MGCGAADPVGCVGSIIGTVVGGEVGGAAGDLALSAWDGVCKSFADAAAQLLGAFGKAFVAIPPVDLGSAGIRNVYGISLGVAATVAALLLIGQVIATAFSHDGSALAQALTGVAKAALAALLTLAVAGAGLEAADQLTDFIVTQTFGSVQTLSAKIAAIVSWSGGAQIQGALLLIFALVGILLTIVLWFEMLLRNAAIAVLVATSPIAAAGQASAATKSWWPKLASATTQLIILKPVIALVFCIGFSLTASSSDVETLLTGMLILLLAVIAWPVVARFFTFASVQVGGGAGLGAVLGFAARRLTAGNGAPGGVEPDEFSLRAESRTMTGIEGASARAGGAGAGAGLAAGGAGLIAAGLTAAARAANSLTGRMEQMAGHAGMTGANPYAQPAGYTQRPARLGSVHQQPDGHAPPAPDAQQPVTDPDEPPADTPAPAAGGEPPPAPDAPPPSAGSQPPPVPEIHHETGDAGPPAGGPGSGGSV